MASNNTSVVKTGLRDGYDLEVYGLKNGSFYYIHIPAITCICISFTCATIAVVLSFRRQRASTFFTYWSKSERFIVYLAVCDGLFNVAHFTDHLHIAIVKDHVYPKELCEFYGFTLAEFITAQNLMVNVVAINAFMLMYFDRNINFGSYDWKLLAWTFGAPFIGATIAGILGQLGPNGSFCYFDGVKGRLTNIFFTTIPLLLVLFINTILYILTWKKIHEQTVQIRETVGKMPASMRATHRAARAMSLFVAAFFIQWWAMALYGLWGLFTTDIPQALFHLVTTFSNIGGILNLGVYTLIRRKHLAKGEKMSKGTHSNDDELKSRTSRSMDHHTQDMSLTDHGIKDGTRY